MDAQDLCLLEAPDVLWPEDFDPQRHAEVCHFLGDVESQGPGPMSGFGFGEMETKQVWF